MNRPSRSLIRSTLEAESLEKSLRRLFVDLLGWSEPSASDSYDGLTAIAKVGNLTLLLSDQEPADQLSGPRVMALEMRDSHSFDLLFLDAGPWQRISVDRDNPGSDTLERLAGLAVPSIAAESGAEKLVIQALRDTFCPSGAAEDFLAEYERVFLRHVDSVRVITTTTGRREKPMEPPEMRTLFLQRFLNRVLLIRLLEDKGWFRFGGRQDYLKALYDDWQERPGPYAFYQRLALVFFNALSQPSAEARGLLRSQVGQVPYLGRGLFAPDQFESEFSTHQGLGVIPDELFEDLLGPSGLLNVTQFSAMEGVPEVVNTAVSPEVLSLMRGRLVESAGDEPDSIELQIRCRQAIADKLGVDVGDLAAPGDKADKILAGLSGVHIFDSPCGTGSYLAAMLLELVGLNMRCSALSESGPEPRSIVSRRLLENSIRGLDDDEFLVQVARFRLALTVLGQDDDPAPRPLPDISQIVLIGDTIDRSSLRESGERAMSEGPQTEFKASFEWSQHQKARSGDLRHASLKTIAAFLNSEGGTLWIGVDDAGRAVGLEDDLALIEDEQKLDTFENRLREFLKNHLDPMPLNSVKVTFPELDGVLVCSVEVDPRDGVTYLVRKDPQSGQVMEEIYVRDGMRTISLKGRSRDQFILGRRP
jgi:hypothetical protein